MPVDWGGVGDLADEDVDPLVWVIVRKPHTRRHYHRPLRHLTVCGEFIGDTDDGGRPIRGWLLPLEEVIKIVGAKPCSKCYR